MADDFTANPGAGGDTFAADDIGGVKYPRSKLVIGADGTNDGDVSSANPLPVMQTGVATEATLDSIDTKVATETTLAAIETLLGGSLAVTGPLTDAELRATPVPVSGTVTITDGSGPVTVDGTVAATQSGTWNITNISGTVSLPTGAATEATLASALTALQLIDNIVSGSGVNVSQINGVAPTMGNGNSGTGVQRVTIAADSTGVLNVGGRAAHDAAVSGNPVRVAGRAQTSDYTSVASGDTADLLCDIKGKMVILPYALHENHWQYAGPAITDTSDDAVKASAGAGLRNYVTSLTVINSHATVGTVVELKDGSTVIHRGYAAPLGGGYTVTFPTPLKGTAATAINVACVTTGSNTYVNASGYVAP